MRRAHTIKVGDRELATLVNHDGTIEFFVQAGDERDPDMQHASIDISIEDARGLLAWLSEVLPPSRDDYSYASLPA